MEQSPEMPCAISRLHIMGKIKMHTQYNLLYRKHLVTSQQIKISFSYVCSFHCTQLCCTNLWSNDVHTTCWLNQCSFPIPYCKRFTLYTCDYSFIDTNLIHNFFYINYIKLSSSTCFERHPLIFRRSMMLIVHVCSLLKMSGWHSKHVEELNFM